MCRHLWSGVGPVASVWVANHNGHRPDDGTRRERERERDRDDGTRRESQRSAAPTAYPRAHWTDNKTRSSCPRPSHWLRKIAHCARLCLRAKTIPHQWHIEARSPSPALGNVAFRHNARPLRQQDASHEGHRICSHPTLLPPPPCCLKSVHELPTTHNVNATSYTLTSPCAHWSRKGACNHIST